MAPESMFEAGSSGIGLGVNLGPPPVPLAGDFSFLASGSSRASSSRPHV